jgi:ribosomal protein L29
MGDTFVISGLRDKRSELAGQIVELEKQAMRLRADLAHVEATLRIFDPSAELERVVPRKLDNRAKWFKNGELSRHCREFLRLAGDRVVSADDIARDAMHKKGIADDRATRIKLIQTALFALNRLAAKGHVEKVGMGKGARWKIALQEPLRI